jgi:hypothetical protein
MKKLLLSIYIIFGTLSASYPQEDSSYAAKYESFNFTQDNYYSVSRFLKIYTAYGIDNYSSPASRFSIDGLPFNLLPLNFYSVDLAPVNKSNYFKTGSDRNFILNQPNGSGINFQKSTIPEALTTNLQAYVGSETGDPLIHVYTQPGNPETNNNINKIVPSGLLTLSNKVNNNYYRFSAGYYGYFITGTKNDLMIQRLNPYYSLKQNKQIYTGLTFLHEYDKSGSLEASSNFISYYGWDISPFLGELAHFENYAMSSKLVYASEQTFSIALKNDLVMNDINNTSFFTGAKTFYSETSLYPAYMIRTQKIALHFTGALNYITASNEQEPGRQQFLSKEMNKFYGGIAFNSAIEAPHNFEIDFLLKYDKHYNDEDIISYSAVLKYPYRTNSSIGFQYSSEAKAPNFNELYGRFNYAYSDTGFIYPEHYIISGNEDLKTGRDNTYSIFYTAGNSKTPVYFKADVFFKAIKDQIGKAPAGINSFTYINYPKGKVFGGNAETQVYLSKWGGINAAYNYLDNKDFIHASKHTFTSQFIYITNFNSEISLAVRYRSKQNWSAQYASFMPTENILPESAVYNLCYKQNLTDFYFFRQMAVKIEVENIFDRAYKNIPRGNNLRRAIVFHLNTSVY